MVLRHKGHLKELSGGFCRTTNNRMELLAAIRALEALNQHCRVDLHTDSQYLRKGVTEWMAGWRAKGWKTAAKKNVANRDLWEALDREIARHEIDWRWVKGHAGNEWNERADELASARIPRPALPVDDFDAVHLFTAVAHSGKADAGAWAVLMSFHGNEKVLSGRRAGASANRMHIMGAGMGLAELSRRVRVHLYTTSDYLKDGATTWVHGWRSRGWTTRDGKPVSHRDLWQTLDRLQSTHRVTWHVLERDADVEQYDAVKRRAKAVLKGEAEKAENAGKAASAGKAAKAGP